MSKVSLLELKHRHESGEEQHISVQRRINKELKRVCKYRDCDKSLAFERAKDFCTRTHRLKEVNRIKKANRLKKQAYNERHGIVPKKAKKPKPFRKDVPMTPGALSPETVTLLYEDYKEPLRAVEPEKGFGYMGTLAMNEERTHVQCHICGNLYKSVGGHLRLHRISSEDYRKEFGLGITTALIGEEYRLERQRSAVKNLGGKGLPKHLEGFNAKFKSGEIKRKGHVPSLEWRNRKGLCPDQVLEKILDLKEKLGHVPSQEEFIAEHKGRYLASIKFQHGSWIKAVHKLGLQSADELRRVNTAKLIDDLRDFYERNGRIPMTSDFNRGLLRDKTVYIRKFGSLNNARLEAGMNAVIPMPFGQILELTPEEYFKYKSGHTIDKKVSKAVVTRRVYRQKASKRKQQIKEVLA